MGTWFLRIKLYTPSLLVLHSNVGRYGTDKPNQFPVCSCPYAAVPGLFPPRGVKGPSKELSAIVKSKHIILIFNIVLTKQYIEFIQLCEERKGEEDTVREWRGGEYMATSMMTSPNGLSS